MTRPDPRPQTPDPRPQTPDPRPRPLTPVPRTPVPTPATIPLMKCALPPHLRDRHPRRTIRSRNHRRTPPPSGLRERSKSAPSPSTSPPTPTLYAPAPSRLHLRHARPPRVVNAVDGKHPVPVKLQRRPGRLHSRPLRPHRPQSRPPLPQPNHRTPPRRPTPPLSPGQWDEDRGLEVLQGGTREILFVKDGIRVSDF